MQVKEHQHENFMTLRPEGELDANSSIVMDDVIRENIDKGHYHLHVDCSGLQYISSAGLGVFISYMDELRENDGKFVFSNMSDNVRQVFRLLGLEAITTIVGNESEAEVQF